MEHPALFFRARSIGSTYPKAASGVLVDQRVDTVQGRDPSEYSYSTTLSASRSSSGNNVMSVEDGRSESVPEAISPADASFTYIGDRRGPRHSVYDLCHPETPEEARYLPPITSITSSHKPHELEYMRLQGVFSKLPHDVCDELVRCYFQHVHFFLPIIDAPAFLNEYCSNGSRNISLLLYWSMLLAAANFVDADVLQKAGFSSRKAMKTAMYERAKCLYDVDRGTDKLVLIQSVILLGFWYTDPQDHTGAWYWIGIAISLSQNIGLHRSRLSRRVQQQSSPARESLMRRIWWACVVRDRWVSLARGRPMRIHNEDCDTPIPAVEDILSELESVVAHGRNKFIPADSTALAEMWIRLSLIELDAIRITAMIPAMQIHLYDCKSTNALTRGLAENKLRLHMLVLSNLRGTYWSADVMYRLFERAQAILSKSNSQMPKPSKNPDDRLSRVIISGNSHSRDFSHIQQQSQPQPQPQSQSQQPQPNGTPMLLTPEPTMMMTGQPPANPWFNASPQFSDVDQLLSPGFYLSEEVYPDFFLGYENAVVYDPLVLGSSRIPDNMLQ
ncbi:c6 transcription factor [Trichoderma arundinaceum]|uniref:C6 transcription factor n=1 Tax=Trichoderma arundinaceum TaxID=490622 RepID=A0A395P103_TRIAR|nr:c6 transcription factor [Trichoderma arundinaceum]